jgi:hypothetical protein
MTPQEALDSTRALNPGWWLDKWWFSLSHEEQTGWLIVLAGILTVYLLRGKLDGGVK